MEKLVLKNNRNNNKTNKYKRKNKFKLVSYNNRTQPSTFGPGSYYISVTKLVSGTLNTETEIRIWNDVLDNNVEFERVKDDFKYFKMNGVAVTFHPRNLPISGNQKPLYMIMNYDGQLTKNLRLQDSAKVIPAYLPRSKVYKFNIPAINSVAGVMNKWTNKSDLATWRDLILQLHAPDNTTEWNFRVDVLITMRGPTVTESSNRISEITTEELRSRKVNKVSESVAMSENASVYQEKALQLSETPGIEFSCNDDKNNNEEN